MGENILSPEALIQKFKYALANNWGYIYGTAGIKWTQAQQNNLVQSFVSKYGSGWKDNANAKNDDKYKGAVYGAKWIGHTVADCSGLFKWAFTQLNSVIAHGSNSIWDKHCSSKGELRNGNRVDGKTLKPGTAIFTNHNGNRSHIGLYIGNNTVIEASGTIAGVIETKITNSKWVEWGELKRVNYSEDKKEDKKEDEVIVVVEYAIVTGGTLNLRASKSTSSTRITTIPNGSKLDVLEHNSDWCKVVYKEQIGYVMTKYLQFESGGKDEKIEIKLSRDCAVALYEALKLSLNK